MLPADDAYTLALLYHTNSEPWMNFEAYSDPGYEMQFKRMPDAIPSLALPKPDIESPLRREIRKRRSCRNFVPHTMPLSQLGDILANSYGASGIIENQKRGSSGLDETCNRGDGITLTSIGHAEGC